MSEINIENCSILCIDYGTKVTGLASFYVGRDPYPLPYDKIIYESDEQIIEQIQQHIDNECYDTLVLGLPLFTDGTESEMTLKVKKFGQQLQKKTELPLYFQDETLTTYEAEQRMKNSPRYNFQVDYKQIDALAASIILEDFLKRVTKGSNRD